MNTETGKKRYADLRPVSRWSRRISTITAACAAVLLLSAGAAFAAPLEGSLLFSVKSDSFAAADGESTGAWASYMPSGQTFATMGNPKVKTFGGVKWVKNLKAPADGYQVLNDGTPIPCAGVTIVAAVKPIYDPTGGEARGEIVDIFYDRLALAISHSDGRIMVCRNYWNDWGPAIPEGQSTVLSLVVQTDGSYEVFANGVSAMTGAANGDFNTLTPPDGWKSWIAIGRNAWDGWSSLSGYLGDVYVYKTALGTTDRQTLEAELTTKFVTAPVNYTIDSVTTGPGGTIRPTDLFGTVKPAGPISVPEGFDQICLIEPASGYTIDTVETSAGSVLGSLVDINYGGAKTYTFSNVLASDTVTVTFAEGAYPSTRYEAESSANSFDNAGSPVQFHPNCSGGACAGKWGDGAIGGFTVTVTAPEGGLYDMTVADGGYGERPTWVKVNGVDLVGNPFTPATRNGFGQGTFACTVALVAGANTITIYAPAGQWGPHWDYIDVADTSSGPANKITSSVGTGSGTISPLGAIYCSPGATIPFTITPDLFFDVSSVLADDGTGPVDVTAGPATQIYPMVNVSVDDTIVASFIAWVPTYITGTVTAGATPLPGVEITATGPRGPFVTTTSDPAGTYSIQVRPGETYTMTAKKSQYTMSAPQDVLAGATADFTATFVGLQPLVDLNAATLSAGPDLASWPNAGSLGGSFNKWPGGTGPNVVADIGGRQAVEFIQPTADPVDRRTLGGTIVTPAEVAGNSDWTVYADLYRANMGWNGESAYLSLAGWWHGYNQCDQFCYVNNKAVDHNGSGWGFSSVPSAGEWHNVTITYDGTTEKIYVDGNLDGSRTIALNIAAGDQIIIGSHSDVTGPDRHWNDQYWRYNGAIAKLQIFDEALTADEIAALMKGPPEGTVLIIR